MPGVGSPAFFRNVQSRESGTIRRRYSALSSAASASCEPGVSMIAESGKGCSAGCTAKLRRGVWVEPDTPSPRMLTLTRTRKPCMVALRGAECVGVLSKRESVARILSVGCLGARSVAWFHTVYSLSGAPARHQLCSSNPHSHQMARSQKYLHIHRRNGVKSDRPRGTVRA